jgi:hypothetical protein
MMTVDMNEVMLTDGHRRAIAETLVGRDVELERVYCQLAHVLEGYQILEQDRKLNRFKKELKRWQHQRELISELIIMRRMQQEGGTAMLKDIQQIPAAERDEEDEPDEPALVRILRKEELWLETLEEMRRQADSYIETLSRLDGAFHKKRHLGRKNLYEDTLRIWRDIIGDELTYSRPWASGGEPYGALIDFFRACLGPILGDKMPGPHGIARIVDRVRVSGFMSECRPSPS